MSDAKRAVFAYTRGWSAGAGVKPYEASDRFADDYERGYRDGRAAYRAAADAEARRAGVTLNVVRTQEDPPKIASREARTAAVMKYYERTRKGGT